MVLGDEARRRVGWGWGRLPRVITIAVIDRDMEVRSMGALQLKNREGWVT